MAEQSVVSAVPRSYGVRVHRRSAHEHGPEQPLPQPHSDPRPTDAPAPPFDAPAARSLRIALGMGPEHVAYGMRSSYGLLHVTPDLVAAWEGGGVPPTGPELTALAGVLWCSTAELIGTPRTLREHRTARGLAAEDVARAAGLELSAYVRTEESEEWHGTDRQAAALGVALDLSIPELVIALGLEGRLRELLHDAVTTRWPAHVRPAARLLSFDRHLDRHLLEDVLREMHTEYQNLVTATLTWANGTAATDSGDAGRDYLDQILGHFWALVRRTAAR
ncbi:helix-turn-helix transcriptional regulator [Streptomyces sp. LBUM 1478]|nr:DNA-binding protein [Streptomyces scabiei]MBP5861063.1 helix-turn-helix transcriptional regulator [Streptomyces sp. LBUM 1484]MBP5869980.1 helix-turn-helix transcriptional regulator [Streptomyces sp. LBUM 1485]MBP5878516.1 helix-turn-helix transcriptional regulator [Streptomyces sp. LBUM 1477]MBP5886359.1 helix-turn-helix transcriptional regulator [Streptomyces sp. LBUM 1487]MBP5902340.1 helix-turn-helix transcriptional regulator [Streptomyces sp. LBUM 1488]MBP5908379.1 helix-turn-helix tr